MSDWLHAWLIALLFAASMTLSWYLGRRYGRHLYPEPGDDPGMKFTDASVALLGLLLAFTFSMSLGRHDQRRLAVVAESNAIGDFYTCASLLKEPKRAQLQGVIRDYAQLQLRRWHEPFDAADEEQAIQKSQKMQAQMTELVAQAVEGTPIAVPLTNKFTDLTSTYASRLAAYDEGLPWSIVMLLFLSSIVPAYLIGMKQEQTRQVHLAGTFSFIVLVSLVVFVVLDLNQPSRGMIKVSGQPLERVVRSMAN
jgi:hypothetical protein